MKRLLLWLGFVLALFSSCSKDVNLLADYKEVPIIYGILNAKADTNFIKITRAFYANSDAYEVAVNPDSSNYPGKLNVRLVEFQNGDPVRTIILDTIIIHNKQPGVFYGSDQKLYYTTERLNMCDKFNKYQYELQIDLPDQTLKTKTDVVGNNSFRIETGAVNFSKEYFGTRRPFLFAPALNASIYDVNIAFTFLEQRTPDEDSVPRTMNWNLGYLTDYELSQNMDGKFYIFYCRPERFHEMLRDFIGGDTSIAGLSRYITDYPIEVTLAAGGESLYRYIHFNGLSDASFSPGDNEFSVIDGAYGVFSSRMVVKRKLRLAGTTVLELLAKRNWGFKFIGGKEE